MIEQRVAEAFRGITADEGIDLADVVGDMDEGRVMFSENELEAIGERILTLQAIVEQNALVSIPSDVDTMSVEPESVFAQPAPSVPELSPERKAQIEAARARAAAKPKGGPLD